MKPKETKQPKRDEQPEQSKQTKQLEELAVTMIREGCSFTHAVRQIMENPGNPVNSYSAACEIASKAVKQAECWEKEITLCKGIQEIFRRRRKTDQPLGTVITYTAGYLEAFLSLYPEMQETAGQHMALLNELKRMGKEVKKEDKAGLSMVIGCYLDEVEMRMDTAVKCTEHMHVDRDLKVSEPFEGTREYIAYVRRTVAAQLYLSRRERSSVCAEIAGCSKPEFFRMMEDSDLTVEDYIAVHVYDPDFKETLKPYLESLPVNRQRFDEMVGAMKHWGYQELFQETLKRFVQLMPEMDIVDAYKQYGRILPDLDDFLDWP